MSEKLLFSESTEENVPTQDEQPAEATDAVEESQTIDEATQEEKAIRRKKALRALNRVLDKAQAALNSADELADDLSDLLDEIVRQYGDECQAYDDVELARQGIVTDLNRLSVFLQDCDHEYKRLEAEK